MSLWRPLGEDETHGLEEARSGSSLRRGHSGDNIPGGFRRCSNLGVRAELTALMGQLLCN